MIARILTMLAVISACAFVLYAIVWGYETWRAGKVAEGDRAGAARVQAQWDEADRKRNTETLVRVAEENLESKRRMAKQETNRAQSETERRAALADARAARAESLRMSEWADAQVRRATAGAAQGADSAPGQQCQTAGSAAGMLADVLKRADDRAGILAEHADRARAAGLQCQRDYEALTLKATAP